MTSRGLREGTLVLELTRCPAGGDHDVHALEVIPAEGPEVLGHDIDGACIKCGEVGFPVYIAPTFCRCGAEINHHGYGWCSAGCPDPEPEEAVRAVAARLSSRGR